MPFAALLQGPKEEARPAREDLGVRIVSVETGIDSISLSAAERRWPGSDSRLFDFEVELNESGRTEDGLRVRYSFTFGRPASGQRCKVSGTAAVQFSRFNPSRDFHTLGAEVTNEMAVEIFRKNYEAVFLLHEALGVDAPSAWITRDVSLSSREVVA